MSVELPISADGPRVIEPRPGRPNVFADARRIAVIPAVLAVVLTLMSIPGLLTVFAGSTAIGVVRLATGSGGHNRIAYQYEYNGHIYLPTAEVDPESFAIFDSDLHGKVGPQGGPKLTVRFSPLLPSLSPIAMVTADMPIRQYGLTWAAAGVADLAFVLLVLPMLLRPQRQLDLLRSGQATAGEIIAIKRANAKNAPAMVTYRFEVPTASGGAAPRTATMAVPATVLGDTDDRATVAVVYSPKKPSQSIIYEFADFSEEEITVDIDSIEAGQTSAAA